MKHQWTQFLTLAAVLIPAACLVDATVDISSDTVGTTGAECMPSAGFEQDCFDGNDDDCDGEVDCGDPDCAVDPMCPGGCEPEETATPEGCFDMIDTDCDGQIDCEDDECQAMFMECDCVVDADMDGVPACMDCDDQNPDNWPGNMEFCDDQDNNCDGQVDEVGCGAMCGNRIADPPEECDGTDLQGETCVSRGYDSGTLACDGMCFFDESGCFDLLDSDGDGVPDMNDTDPGDAQICSDIDNDTCDDCSVAFNQEPFNDGPDNDSDGLCDPGDADDDNDGVDDAEDADPLDNTVCRDVDLDTCDDCTSGMDDVANDGPDFDADGICDAGDSDSDGDGVPDVSDSDPLNPFLCQDSDSDTCEDCISGTNNPNNDGQDTDFDGQCDVGDPDDDNDGVLDGADSDALDPDLCEDADGDACDDCAVGTDDFGPLADNDVANDGTDTDSDGLCDFGDADDDNDGVVDPADNDPLNPFVCENVDLDPCDDCAIGDDQFGPNPDNLPMSDGC